MTVDAATSARFWAKVNNTGTCWLWTGALREGYGSFFFEGANQRAHRVSFVMAGGSIPHGLQLDHLCRVRSCVRPDHLEPVTQAENIRRGIAGEVNRARLAAISHCPAGHPYDAANTIHEGKSRKCRACRRARDRERGKHRRAAARLNADPLTWGDRRALKGHGLIREGRPSFVDPSCTDPGCQTIDSDEAGGQWDGHGRCSCGAISPHLPSVNQRRKWHREHKDELR